MAETTAIATNRHYAALLGLLTVASFLLYAAGVLIMRQDRIPGWATETSGAFPAAVSYLVYGTPLGAVDQNVEGKFTHPDGMKVQDILALAAARSIPPGAVRPTTIDGNGFGMAVFSTAAMAAFGPNLFSLILMYLLMIGITAVAFALRFHDKRLIVVPLYFLVATVMLLTPLGVSAASIDQMPIGGQRYFVMATFIPALHIFFEIIDRSSAVTLRRTIANALLLLLQALLLFGALLVRTSTGYVLGVLLAVWIWRLYRNRAQPTLRSALLRDGAVAACAFIALATVVATALPAYLQTGRVFSLFWHRAFISFAYHPDWPFGDLRQVYDCTKAIPEGLNRETIDRNGHCVWLVYPPNAKRSDDEINRGIYGGEYEKALRQAYFYVVTHYPKQTLELYAVVKPQMIEYIVKWAWRSLLDLPHAPVTEALFIVAAMQFLIFVAFAVSVALVEGAIIGPPMAIFPIFFIASLVPLCVAWASEVTSTDTIFLMYSCLALAVLLLVQVVVQTALRRTPMRSAERSYPPRIDRVPGQAKHSGSA